MGLGLRGARAGPRGRRCSAVLLPVRRCLITSLVLALALGLPGNEPTWIGDELYVQRTESTENLSARHAVTWWRERWG